MAAMLTRLKKYRQKNSSKDRFKLDFKTKIYDSHLVYVSL